jgi:hypothetical protein
MPFQLRKHVTFCLIGGRAIFLDLARDRYFALGRQAAEAFKRALEPAEGDCGTRDFAILVECGLGEQSSDVQSPRPAPSHVPTRSLLDGRAPAGRMSARVVLEITAALLRSRRAVRRGRLNDLVDEIAARKTCRSGANDPEKAGALARIFASARPFAPVGHSCLTDSLALIAFLARRGAAADLVFGVKLHPFAAHAWVQTQDELLNEHVDAAAEFTPILVV